MAVPGMGQGAHPGPAAPHCLLCSIPQECVISFSDCGMSGVPLTLIIPAPLLDILN